MLERVLKFSIERRVLVVMLVAVVAAFGARALLHLPIDAVPDITSNQVQITEQLTELSGNLIDTLFHIAKCGFPVPADFDDSVLEDTRIDTAWQPLHVQDIAFQEKLNKLRCECQRLTDFAESNGIITVDDDEAMELIEFELDEEDAAIEAMHEERIRMDITGRYHNFPPPL